MKKVLLLLISCLSSTLLLANHWTPVQHPSGFNMSVTCVVQIDEQLSTSLQIELGAFDADGICRGSQMPMENPFIGGIVYMMQVNGTDGNTFTFKLFNHDPEQNKELDLVSPTLTYQSNGYGNPLDPYILDFTTPAPQPTTYTLPIPGYGSSTGGYHLISSPVTAEIEPSATNGFLTSAYDLYYFNQEGDDQGREWFNYKDTNYGGFNIVNGKGYLYASQTDTQLQFTGTACTNGEVALIYSEENDDHSMWGWNLIGNPLAQDASINRACYVMNTDGTELASAASGTLIPAMNGVFVKATGTGQSVTFTPSTSGSGTEVAKVVLNVLRDRAATLDRAIVCFDENSTLPKFMLDSNNTKVYIPESGEQFAVVSSARQNSLPVNFKAKENGTYSLSVDINNIEMEYLHLIDNMTGADIDLLQQPSYQFNASTSDYESRFMLAFRAETGVQEQGQESFCFVNGRSLYFCEDVEGATLNLVDMTGRMVRNESLKGNGVSLDNLSEGVYVVRLAKGNDVKTQKVVVR